MSCLSELKCSVYADGELPDEEAREVTRHLASCGACRQTVASLRFERSALIQSLQDIDLIEFELEHEVLAAPRQKRLSVAKFAAFVLAMAVLLRPVLTALGEFQLPLSAAAEFDLLLGAVVYGIPAMIDSMNAFLNIASWIIAGSIVCGGLFMLFRKSPVASTLVSVLTLLTVFSPWTYAFDVRRGEKPVNVPAGETIDDTLIVTGDSAVDVDGTINGDLIVLARDVRVKGTVKGNLISFAQRTEIDGTVQGSVLGGGGSIDIRGNVSQNVYGIAGSVRISENAQIDGNVSMFIGEATLEGSVGKDFYAYSAGALGFGRTRFTNGVSSERGGIHLDMSSEGDSIQVLRRAHIGRNLWVKVGERETATIDPAASIGGKRDIEVAPIPPSKYVTASFYVWQTIWLAAAFLVGLILLWGFPVLGKVQLNTAGDLLLSGGIGLAAAVVPPFAAVIAGLTLVGLPLAFITFGMWFAALYLAKIIIAAFVGRSLLGRNTEPSTPLMLIAGLVPVYIATNIPFVGALITFFLVVLGLGAMVMTIYQSAHQNPSGSVAALTT